jgi:hypothetical protein
VSVLLRQSRMCGDVAMTGRAMWEWIAWGNASLRDVLAYATFVGVMYTVWSFWRSRRIVTIYAVNDDDPARERREIAKVPASFVDFSRFAFDYWPGRTVEVPLPAESFRKLARHDPHAPRDPAPPDRASVRP